MLLTYFRGTTILIFFQILCALAKLGSVLAGTFSELGTVNCFLTNPDWYLKEDRLVAKLTTLPLASLGSGLLYWYTDPVYLHSCHYILTYYINSL